jgi:Zn-dependent M28 family amino/carboxypeptidase
MAAFRSVRGKKANLLVLMHSSQEPFFKRIKDNSGPKMKDGFSTIFVMTNNTKAEAFDLDLKLAVEEVKMSNVVGMIPGKSKPDEYVVFSGHYDHIGVGKADDKGDSIYNGANDDASGTTAVMMLAKHFAGEATNERTLVFAAFTAEEVGGFGSQYFSKQLDPAKVMAMFNIEMIGTDSKWGTNSAYITGYEKSNMGEILQKNLQGSPFQFHPDPYPQQQLFYRSDNATLARLGVPAHTISTSKMDSEPHYHRPSDERSTLDTKNMTEIIKAIAISSKSIAAGTDTPSRVDTTQLR